MDDFKRAIRIVNKGEELLAYRQIGRIAAQPSDPRDPDCERGIKAASEQLCELTKRWTIHEDIPRSQQSECRDIGRKLHGFGGEAAMRDAYYEAIGRNRAASMVAAYFDGIGEWRW